MYVTVRTYEGVDSEQLRKRSESRDPESGLMGLISKYPGFIAYSMVDLGDGKLMTISMYGDRVEAEVANETAQQWTKEHMADIIPHPPEVVGGYVLRHAQAP